MVDAGVSQDKAYSIYKSLEALAPAEGEDSVTKYQKVSLVLKQDLTPQQKVSIVSTMYTSHDKNTGAITTESLLPYLTNAPRLLSLYTDPKYSEVVSMVIPDKITQKDKVYELTDAEKATFKQTFMQIFNSRDISSWRAEEVAKLRTRAYEAAKDAALRGRQ
jgi:hypothetical protein